MIRQAYGLSNISRVVVVLTISLVQFSSTTAQAQWAQFGGPHRNFSSDEKGLNTNWPADGPRKLWTRDLGDGYSAISVDGNVLYTMYGKGRKESVIALDADSGKTLWEYTYPANLFKKFDKNFGAGPRATPLIVDERVYTLGAAAMMFCLDQKTGKRIWSHDLIKEFGATKPRWGYASSALAYKLTVIVPVGGQGHGIMAFDQKSGSVVWARHDFANGYSSPILIDVGGQEQLVVFMADEVVGLNPANGDLYWTHPHKTAYQINASMPIWSGGEDNILFITSAYDTGARGLKLTRSGDKTSVKELWHQSKMKVHFGSAIRIGDYVYGSTGGSGPVFFTAINIHSGKISLRKRNVMSKAQLLYADGKLIMLDEDGDLAIATATPDDIEIHSKVSLLEKVAWTVPTLVDGKLYIRDLKSIMALELE